MKILFLTPRFPYPLIGGDRLKPYFILTHLAKSHEVTLVSFYQGGAPPKSYVKVIENAGIELHTIPLNPVQAGLRVLPRIFKGMPLEVLYYTQPEFARTVDSLMAAKQYDLGISFFMRTAEYLKNKNIKKILMAEDCRTVYQKRSFEESQNIKQKFVRWWEYHKLKYYEKHIVDHFDLTTFVTHEDIKSMTGLNPHANYGFLTNGVDIRKFVPPPEDTQRSGILFAGKLDIWANVLMLRKIVSGIMPIIRKEIPGATLDIVGANPSNSMLRLARENSFIKLHADVPEMYPYMQQAKLFIHPHHGGSGIQNKLLEALACGCPVVTTPTGIQGIPARNGIEALIGTSDEELALHAIRIMKDEAVAGSISRAARAMIERTNSWYVVFDAIDNIIYEMFENRVAEGSEKGS